MYRLLERTLATWSPFFTRKAFLTLLGVHIVGHSLGAHVAGHAARQVYKKTKGKHLIWRISALDPAGPLYWKSAALSWYKNPYPRLHRSRTGFLDVYHTSERYGTMEEMGDVDFYINGSESQPACKKGWWIPWISYLTSQQCSHSYATKLFAKSINDKTMIACAGCWDYDEFKDGTCGKCEEEDEVVLGEYVVDKKYHDGYPTASGQAFYKIDTDL